MAERSVETSGSRRFLRRLAGRQVIALALAASVLLVVTAAALAATGDLTQPAGTAGCINDLGLDSCANGHAIGANGVAVSPDGKSVYTVGGINAVARLNRNPTTGAITQPAGTAGCISETGHGPCADGHGLFTPDDVAVSPDGKNVYVTAFTDSAVVRLTRNPTTGAISQPAGAAGCISDTGSGGCVDGHDLDEPLDLAVSPDGKSVYVAAGESNAVVRLNRNTTTGNLTQPAGPAGCVSETSGTCGVGHGLIFPTGVTVSPDGKNVYAGTSTSNSVVRLDRDTTTGAITQPAGVAGCVSETGVGPCADGHALRASQSVAVSPDGKNVYAASASDSRALVRLNRNTTTGAIFQPPGVAGCISQTGTGGTCADGRALLDPQSVAVSPDGRSVYVASSGSNAVARFNRGTTSGGIAQPAGAGGCASETGAGPCANVRGLFSALAVAVSPNGRSVYVSSTETPSSEEFLARFNRTP